MCRTSATSKVWYCWIGYKFGDVLNVFFPLSNMFGRRKNKCMCEYLLSLWVSVTLENKAQLVRNMSCWLIKSSELFNFYFKMTFICSFFKALKPSNHATIQSIVRAVGVVPGIPEPCCVPEKMSSLSILFFDEDKNVVLKVYPNMTVDSCACR